MHLIKWKGNQNLLIATDKERLALGLTEERVLRIAKGKNTIPNWNSTQ